MLVAGPIFTLALNILILSIFYISMDLLPIILLNLVGVELPLCVVVTLLECCVTFSQVQYMIVCSISTLGKCFSHCLSSHCSKNLDINQSSKDSIRPGLPALAGCINCWICLTYFWSTCHSV